MTDALTFFKESYEIIKNIENNKAYYQLLSNNYSGKMVCYYYLFEYTKAAELSSMDLKLNEKLF